MEKIFNVFCSVPMNGRTDREIKEDIKKCENYAIHHIDPDMLKENGYTVMAFKHNYDTSLEPGIKALAVAIDKIADCDAVVFADNYDKARGCMIEYAVAKSYNKMCRFYGLEKEKVIFNGIGYMTSVVDDVTTNVSEEE